MYKPFLSERSRIEILRVPESLDLFNKLTTKTDQRKRFHSRIYQILDNTPDT